MYHPTLPRCFITVFTRDKDIPIGIFIIYNLFFILFSKEQINKCSTDLN